MGEPFLTVRELAAQLRVAENTLRHWMSERRIPYVKVGRRSVFDPVEIRRWLEPHHVREAGPRPDLATLLSQPRHAPRGRRRPAAGAP